MKSHIKTCTLPTVPWKKYCHGMKVPARKIEEYDLKVLNESHSWQLINYEELILFCAAAYKSELKLTHKMI